MSEKIQQIRLSDITVDSKYSIRKIKEDVVRSYRYSMITGSEFPPLILNNNNNIISGFHRYNAYTQCKSPITKIPCIIKEFKTTKDAVICAINENINHGERLSSWDLKNIIIRLQDFGESEENIMKFLHLPDKRYERLRDEVISVDGKLEPGKASLFNNRGKNKRITTTREKYEEMAKHDIGRNDIVLVNQLLRHFDMGTIQKDKEELKNKFIELRNVINMYYGLE